MRTSWITGSICAILLAGCIPAVPSDLIAKIEDIDHDLIALGAPEAAPEEYADFARQWAALKVHAQAYDDLIRWPWESSSFEDQLRRLQTEGGNTVTRLTDRQTDQRRTAETTLARLEERFLFMASQVASFGGHVVLGEKPAQTDLLIKQARLFFEQKHYARSLQTAEQANHALQIQTAALTRELKRYADHEQLARWQAIARQTVEWSRANQSTAIVVSKADRQLILYKNGRKVLSYSVRLGFNGIREKQFQGDGATPEGRYRVTAMRGNGETQFFRALVLDYPNREDRRRFQLAKQAGMIAQAKSIGGQIEIHGGESELMSQTLGCIMLDNPHMSTLFAHVSPGTPVTIVGALTGQNTIALALAGLGNRQNEI
jgi:lipoprotein-anchoring transpeptidase ErfK/SrfK